MKIILIALAILYIIGCQGGKITCKDGKLESLYCGTGMICHDSDYINSAKACK